MRLSGRKQSSLPRRWTAPRRVALIALMSVFVASYVGQILLEAYQPGFVAEFLGISDRGIADAYAWQFVTALFLHTGPWNLVANLLLLYVVGRDVESIVGQRNFVLIYLAGAFAGEFSHLFLMPYNCVLYAASGGVAAIFVAYVAILPELELTTLIFFVLPIRFKAKHLALCGLTLTAVFVAFDRTGIVNHSGCIGGAAAGWLYAHLLGFGRPSILQRTLQQRRAVVQRIQSMTAEEFIASEVDPLLEKIARSGLGSLSRAERRTLAQAREKMLANEDG